MAKDKYTIRITKAYPNLIDDIKAIAEIRKISTNRLIILILIDYLKDKKQFL